MNEFDILLCGGRQSDDTFAKEDWNHFKKALVVGRSSSSGLLETLIEYETPSDHAPKEGASNVFKAAHVDGDSLYTCSLTEFLKINLGERVIVNTISFPMFNDLHHVVPCGDDSYLAANTGLDMVVRFSDEEVIKTWDVLGEDSWSKFNPTSDYRLVPSTKPHKSHPNYVFELDGEVWATRFHQKDAVNLSKRSERIDIGVGNPHDGVRFRDKLYFTSVNGFIVIADVALPRKVVCYDLNRFAPENVNLGWCRGVAPVDKERVWVGFSRLRPTKFRENLRSLKHKVGLSEFSGNLPTRILLVNLATDQIEEEIDLENIGMNAVFSIHVVSD